MRRLYRSRRHRIVAGVCGGLAEWLGWRPVVVRILFVLIGALPVLPGILVYVVLWLVIPEEDPLVPSQTPGGEDWSPR